MKDRVLLIGSYPPPYGGCSVHVMRLYEALRETLCVEVIDLYSGESQTVERGIVRCGRQKPMNAARAVWALLRRPASLVHFHVAGMDAFLIAAYPMLAALRPKTRKVITIHSGSFVSRFMKGPAWRRMMLRDVLRHFNKIITVNDEQRNFLEFLGIKASRIVVLPAFLPPVSRESARARKALRALEHCDRIIVSSGYGLPYYGFDCIIDALDMLSGKDRCGLILCTYNTFDEAYTAQLERRFAGGVPGAVLRDLAPEEFAWLLEQCDVYIRATDRDGDAVAIREAQYYHKTVIASDCVRRPANVKLFKTNEAESLAQALIDTYDTQMTTESRGNSPELLALLNLYREILN